MPENDRKKPIIVAIIQARMNSSRLPGKALKDLCGMPILAQLISRIDGATFLDKIIVATTDTENDDPIETLCKNENILIFRGSENDVLERIVLTSKQFSADIIVRLTADNPFVNAELIDLILYEFEREFPHIDYMSNTEKTHFPHGLYVEVIKASILEKLNAQELSERHREHVTTFIRENPYLFKLKHYYGNFVFNYKNLSIDTEEDYKRLSEIFRKLQEQSLNFGLKEISNLNELCKDNNFSNN